MFPATLIREAFKGYKKKVQGTGLKQALVNKDD